MKNFKFIYVIALLFTALSCCNVNKNNDNPQVLFIKGQCELASYDFYHALNSFEKYIEIANDDSLEFEAYCGLYQCYFRIKDSINTRKAINNLDRLVVNKKKSYNLFNYYFTKSLRENELYNYQNAIAFARIASSYKKPNDTNTIFLNYKIGAYYQNLNNIDSCSYFKNKALQLSWLKKNRNSFEIANVFNGIAAEYIEYKKDYYTGSCYYDSMLYIMNHTYCVDSDYYAWNLFNVGWFYLDKGFIKKSNQYYSQALNIYENMRGNYDDEKNYIQLDQALNIECTLQKYNNASDKIEKVLNYYLLKKNVNQIIRTYYYKAELNVKIENYLAAILYYNMVIKLHNQYQLPGKEQYYIPIADCYANLKMDDSAKFWYNTCFKLLKDEKLKLFISEFGLYSNYAHFLTARNQPLLAIKIIDEHLETMKSRYGLKSLKYGHLLIEKAHAYKILKRNKESLENYQQALISSIDPDFTGSVFDVPEFKQSEIVSPINLIDAMVGKADVLNSMSSSTNNSIFYFEKSLEHYKKAATVVENHKKTMVFESDKLTYSSYKFDIQKKVLTTAMKLYWNYPRENKRKLYLVQALEAADRGKASVLTQNIKENEYKLFSGIPENLLDKEKKLKENIILLQNTIREEKKRAKPNEKAISKWQGILVDKMNQSDSLEIFFEEKFNSYYNLKYNQTGQMDIFSIQDQLRNNQSIIEYSFCGDSLYCFIINKKQIYVTSFPSTDIDQKTGSLRHQVSYVNENSFTKSGIKKYIDDAFWLYSKLIKPIENKIEGNNIIVITDGVLNTLPFEALVYTGKEPAQADYGLLPYLVNKFTISYAYSAKLFNMQQHLSSPLASGISVYSPDYGKEINTSSSVYKNLKPLPGAKEETKEILSIYSGKKYFGQQASELSFKQHSMDNRIIHLAMHTMIDNENPMYSKLAFSPGTDSVNDGLLNTYEIYNLKLKTPLLVLSACNTGYGKMMQGEGLISLSRGFIYAGCPSMVMTLWSIADRSSAEIMKHFYQQIKNGQNVDYSLRLAKLSYIYSSDSRYSHPYYWAGFIQSGQTKPISSIRQLNGVVIIATILFALIAAIGAIRHW
jgi:CHAT domain-containing protein